jgi:hypothetical protein
MEALALNHMPKTDVQLKTKVALEEQLSTGYKLATIVIMGSGLIAFALFTTIWKLKV